MNVILARTRRRLGTGTWRTTSETRTGRTGLSSLSEAYGPVRHTLPETIIEVENGRLDDHVPLETAGSSNFILVTRSV